VPAPHPDSIPPPPSPRTTHHIHQLHLEQTDKSEGNEAAKEEDFFAQCDNEADFNVQNNNVSKVWRHTQETRTRC